MATSEPYTYLIGWSTHNKWYYGVRYADNCTSADLFVTYFTSSKIVKAFIKEHGHPDVIKVRRKFETANQAIAWEHKVLRKMRVIYKDEWLNKSVCGVYSVKGKKRSAETRKRMSEAKMGANNPFFGMKLSNDHVANMRSSLIERYKTNPGPRTGSIFTAETKERMRLAMTPERKAMLQEAQQRARSRKKNGNQQTSS